MTPTDPDRHFHLVPAEQAGLRLDQCVARAFAGLSRRRARGVISDGEVWLNGKPTRVLSRRVSAGDRITWFPAEEEGEPSQALDWERLGGRPELVFRDHSVAIVNKPSGVATEPTRGEDLRTSLRRLEALLREEGVHPSKVFVAAAHRLDTQASGLVAFALSREAAAHLSAQFAARTASRTYHALVSGLLEGDEERRLEGDIAKVGPGSRRGVVPAGEGKRAVTWVRPLERLGDATWVELRLETGRTHQIRVHMSDLGHPLLGDRLYGPRPLRAERLMLHARRLTLEHPDGRELALEAPHPADFTAALESLRGGG